MTATNDLERRVSDFYASEAPPRAPEWLLHSALETIETTPQRRPRLGASWRYPTMNSFAKLAVAAVAVITVGAIGLSVLTSGRPGPGAVETPTPSLAPSPSPTGTPRPEPTLPPLTQSYTSTIHGFSIQYPDGWVARPATEAWTGGIPAGGSPAVDNLSDGSVTSKFVAVASQPLGETTADAWTEEFSTHAEWGDTCAITTEPVTVDGVSGVLVIHCPDDTPSAFLVAEGRGYIIIGYNLGSLQAFQDVLETVQLSPENAVDP
jgi:hypothetical protein